ncbi:elongation factor 1-beta [Candidatus Pacearchaeota archaeon]|nr:elongation factor 1-beta [Candidatus Pacearchaeota archaeon]
MGIALIKIKLMPTAVDTNLDEIKEKAKVAIESNKGKHPMFEEEPIAFGLKAVIAGFELDEEDELDPIEEALRKIETVNSAEVVDMRRAFG